MTGAMKMTPWIGAAYKSKATRILMVGESAYSNEYFAVTERANVELIEDQIENNHEKAIRMMARAVSNSDDPEPSCFWNSVAYANFIAFDIGIGSKARPTKEQWRQSRPLFRNLMDELLPSPTHIVVFGKLTWKAMPEEDYNENEFLQGYRFKNGRSAIATYVYHPSRPKYFKLNAAQRHIRNFLKKSFDSQNWRWSREMIGGAGNGEYGQ